MMKKVLMILMMTTTFFCCKKSGSGNNSGGGGVDTLSPVDPPAAATIGFFLQDWTPRSFTIPSYTEASVPTTAATTFVTMDPSSIITKIPKTVFGQNANIWMTQMVTEPVLMSHLTNLKPGVIRFPGGSLSDVYFWNEVPGQHPADAPDSLLDASGNK